MEICKKRFQKMVQYVNIDLCGKIFIGSVFLRSAHTAHVNWFVIRPNDPFLLFSIILSSKDSAIPQRNRLCVLFPL